MPIVSVSIDKETLSELSQLERELGFSGRSEAVRSAVSTLISENNQRKKLTGTVKAVLLAVHGEAAEERATDIKHSFEDVIATQIHSNLRRGKCLEIFVLDGDASRVKEFVARMQGNKGMEYVKLVVP
ncbi:Putative nickel-responsive regulator [uncultured archaeon]|nr:Putative nickel-responsive regulator [uncultured archaeon]